jgi:hypothetical protein
MLGNPSSPRSVTMPVAPYSPASVLSWFVAAHSDDLLGAELLAASTPCPSRTSQRS